MNKLTNASFSQLVVQYERLVYTVCFQLVRDAAAAEDLTQETFLSAYLHRDAIPPGYERQWLCRVATNKAKDYLQSAYQRHTLLPGFPEQTQEILETEEIYRQQGAGRPVIFLVPQDRIIVVVPGLRFHEHPERQGPFVVRLHVMPLYVVGISIYFLDIPRIEVFLRNLMLCQLRCEMHLQKVADSLVERSPGGRGCESFQRDAVVVAPELT